MIVFNTTFHIEDSVVQEAQAYLANEYIPQAMASGFLMHPKFRKVIKFEEGQKGENFCVQFHVKNIETLNLWSSQKGKQVNEALMHRFGQKVVGFSTLLDELKWEQ